MAYNSANMRCQLCIKNSGYGYWKVERGGSIYIYWVCLKCLTEKCKKRLSDYSNKEDQ